MDKDPKQPPNLSAALTPAQEYWRGGPHTGLDRRGELKGEKAFAPRQVRLLSREDSGVRFERPAQELEFETRDRVLSDRVVAEATWAALRAMHPEEKLPHKPLACLEAAGGARVFAVDSTSFHDKGVPTAPPGTMVAPEWMLQVLGVPSGTEVTVRAVHADHVDYLELAPHHPHFHRFFPEGVEFPLARALSDPGQTNVLVLAPPFNEGGPPGPPAPAVPGAAEEEGALLRIDATFKGQPLPLSISPSNGKKPGDARLFWFDVLEVRTGRGKFDGTTPEYAAYALPENAQYKDLPSVPVAMLFGNALAQPSLTVVLKPRVFINGGELPRTPLVRHPLLPAFELPPAPVRERVRFEPGETWPPGGGGGVPLSGGETLTFFVTVREGAGLEVVVEAAVPDAPPVGGGGGAPPQRLPEVYVAMAGTVERPHPREFTWAHTDALGVRKVLYVEPSDPLVLARAARGAAVSAGASMQFNVSLHSPAPHATVQVRVVLREVPADCPEAKARAVARATALAPLAPGEVECHRCGAHVPSVNRDVHEVRCAKSVHCAVCRRTGTHFHCADHASGCGALFGCEADAERHFEVLHAAFDCERCGKKGMMHATYAAHLTAPAEVETACRVRTVTCDLCTLADCAEPMRWEQLRDHRSSCKHKTHQCAKCTKTLKRQYLAEHLNKKCAWMPEAAPPPAPAKPGTCPSCTFENEPTATRCSICQSLLGGGSSGGGTCPSCSFQNEPGSSSCSVCSSPLGGAAGRGRGGGGGGASPPRRASPSRGSPPARPPAPTLQRPAPARPAAPGAPPARPAPAQPDKYPALVEELMNMGFDRDSATVAANVAKGNRDRAVEHLLP